MFLTYLGWSLLAVAIAQEQPTQQLKTQAREPLNHLEDRLKLLPDGGGVNEPSAVDAFAAGFTSPRHGWRELWGRPAEVRRYEAYEPHVPPTTEIWPWAPSAGDAIVYKRLEAVRRTAAHIRVDGKDADWAGIPSFANTTASDVSDLSRCITRVGIAPREHDLLVLIGTAAKPSRAEYAFSLCIDLMGHPWPDLRLDLSPGGRHYLWVYDEGRPQGAKEWNGAEMAIGDAVEVRIPYRALANELPVEWQEALTGKTPRPWLRVRTWTCEEDGPKIVDVGPVVASYFLRPTPYPLDAPLPLPRTHGRAVELPLMGKWYLGQGPFGPQTHEGIWAYDFWIQDRTFQGVRRKGRAPLAPFRPVFGFANEESYSWGEPVFAPASGRVRRAYYSTPDKWDPRAADNHVLLDLGDDVGLALGHLKQASLMVAPGDRVRTGMLLGRVGNSGNSNGPHLHLALLRLSREWETMPIILNRVRVGLNPGADDPWVRELAEWVPREGVFVERLRSQPQH
jgi:Peptidase family M23